MHYVGTAANVVVQHPHSIKYANCLARAVLIEPDKHGKRSSLEGMLKAFAFIFIFILFYFHLFNNRIFISTMNIIY